ncbi:MAG TPA: hypothetical protein VFU35_13320 [Jatrophihabitans sp.]|nr:hypothetical protein [Jatrophihabitans sp.]
MYRGTLLAESLRLGVDLVVPGLRMTRCGRHDVSASATLTQPKTWTFIHFEVDDDRVDELAASLSSTLLSDDGWYADFRSDREHFVVFAGKIFRYPKGDTAARDQVIRYGRDAGTPAHQLDWEDVNPSAADPEAGYPETNGTTR